MQELKQAAARRPNLLQTVSAVLWSFFGVRKGRDHDRDMAQLNPVHVVITGVVFGVLFVLTLLMIVKSVIN
ncbi:MAG: DUF2970 domain-containing protein [Betaproteobacteria bacterium]|jgi:hypothetical protein|nr:DUF2970 domain-containing protein [Betaproteobacteria bacterium]